MKSNVIRVMAIAITCFVGMFMAWFNFWGWTFGSNSYIPLALQVGTPIFVLVLATLKLFPKKLWLLLPIPIYWVALTPIAMLLVGILLGEPFEGRGNLSDELLTMITTFAMIILYLFVLVASKFMIRSVKGIC